MINPRGFAAVFLRALVLSGVFTGLAWFTFMVAVRNAPAEIAFQSSLVCGLFFGSVFAVVVAWSNRLEILELSSDEASRSSLVERLGAYGYQPGVAVSDVLFFKPGFFAGILCGAITLRFTKTGVCVSGPASYVRRLQRDFRGAPRGRKPEQV